MTIIDGRLVCLAITAVVLTFGLVYFADSFGSEWEVVQTPKLPPTAQQSTQGQDFHAAKQGQVDSKAVPNGDTSEGGGGNAPKGFDDPRDAKGNKKKKLMTYEEKHWLFGSNPVHEFLYCNETRKMTARSKLAIITISHDPLRDVRPHVPITAKYMRMYAQKVGADFHVVDSTCAETLAPYETAKALNISIRRSMKLYAQVDFEARARMQKLLVGKFLSLYERILLLDDTVLVNPGAPDLFKIVPDGWLAASFERPKSQPPYPDWWITQRIRWFCAHYLKSKCYGLHNIFNSGVMLFDSSMQNTLFDPKYYHRYKYVSGFFDQAYFNAMMMGHKIPFFDLGVSFNQVGSLIKANKRDQLAITGLVNEEVCFPHMTRAIPNRATVAKLFQRMYKKANRTGTVSCKYECGDYGCWVPGGPLPKPLEALNMSTVPIQKKERWDHAHHKWVILKGATDAKFADEFP